MFLYIGQIFVLIHDFFLILVGTQEQTVDLEILCKHEEISKSDIDKTVDILNRWKLYCELSHGNKCTYNLAIDIIKTYQILKTSLTPTLVRKASKIPNLL